MSSGSDVEMQSALPKKTTKKTPKSPSVELLKKNQEPKKISTKDMVREALAELHTRKGVSLYAIKKFITEKHNVNSDKINYLLKKTIKSEVESGVIIQTKGIGASGSFKLAPKKKPEKTIKKKVENSKTEKSDKIKKTKKDTEKIKAAKKITKKKDEAPKSSKPPSKKVKTLKDGDEKKVKVSKIAKEKQTPAKKRAAMMRRKSIGSIIKAPKMKPKAREQ